MPAVLRVYLCEAEDFRVGQRTSVLLLNLMKVSNLILRESKTLFFIIFLNVIDMLYWFRFMVNGENALVQSVIHALKHRVIISILGADGEIFLYTAYALHAHVLGNFHGIGTPRGNHLAAWSDEETVEFLIFQECRVAIEPAQFADLIVRKLMVNLSCNHAL